MKKLAAAFASVGVAVAVALSAGGGGKATPTAGSSWATLPSNPVTQILGSLHL